MNQQLEMLSRYKQLRQIGLPLNNRLTKTLTKDEIHEGGRKLGILKGGTLVLDNEDEIAVLMDFCLHDVWRGGTNAIERFIATTPPPADSDEMLILEGKRAARFSLFVVTAVEPGVGVQVRDWLSDEEIFLTDVGFSNSARVGWIMAFRLTTVDGISFTTGAALPLMVIPPAAWADFSRRFVSRFKKMVPAGCTPQQRSEFAAAMIRACRRQEGASRIRYTDPDEDFEEHRAAEKPAPRVVAVKKKLIGANDRCLCGSGRKFKNCCRSHANQP